MINVSNHQNGPFCLRLDRPVQTILFVLIFIHSMICWEQCECFTLFWLSWFFLLGIRVYQYFAAMVITSLRRQVFGWWWIPMVHVKSCGEALLESAVWCSLCSQSCGCALCLHHGSMGNYPEKENYKKHALWVVDWWCLPKFSLTKIIILLYLVVDLKLQ